MKGDNVITAKVLAVENDHLMLDVVNNVTIKQEFHSNKNDGLKSRITFGHWPQHLGSNQDS